MRTALVLTLLIIVLAGASSCVRVDDYNSENLPWSTPASWENTTIGIKH